MGKTVISADDRFEWEEDKSRINKKLHGLYFYEILPAFDDSYLSYTEPISGRTRIISARPAEPHEERMYYEWRKNFIS